MAKITRTKMSEKTRSLLWSASERYNSNFEHYEVVTGNQDQEAASFIIKKLTAPTYIDENNEEKRRFQVRDKVYQMNRKISDDPNCYRETYYKLKKVANVSNEQTKIEINRDLLQKKLKESDYAAATIHYLTMLDIDPSGAEATRKSSSGYVKAWKEWVQKEMVVKLPDNLPFVDEEDNSWITELLEGGNNGN